MPKLKSNRGALKRFRVTATGKVKREKAGASHLLGKKSAKRKRQLRHPTLVSQADRPRIRRLLHR